MLGMNTMAWGAEEQRLLEQALKTYPVSTPDRWDRIADCVPNRTKKDCMRRYKVSAVEFTVYFRILRICWIFIITTSNSSFSSSSALCDDMQDA